MRPAIQKNLPFYATLLALTVVALVAFYQPAEAQRTGPYTLVAHSNETANVGVFRVNNGTGQVSFCMVEGAGQAVSVRCTPEVD
ncbi:MAG: hypothetical protein AB7G06_04215 [Bdellovibrionales bacterium]